MAPTLSHHENNYDFLRLLLATMVIWAHSYALLGETEPTLGGISVGALAVNGFFAISGCFITISWLRSRSLWSFARKRIARIYPGFLAAAVLCLLFVLPVASSRGISSISSISTAKTTAYLLTLRLPPTPGVFPGLAVPAINGSLWTIKYEFMCYMALAMLGLLGVVNKRRFALILFVLSIPQVGVTFLL